VIALCLFSGISIRCRAALAPSFMNGLMIMAHLRIIYTVALLMFTNGAHAQERYEWHLSEFDLGRSQSDFIHSLSEIGLYKGCYHRETPTYIIAKCAGKNAEYTATFDRDELKRAQFKFYFGKVIVNVTLAQNRIASTPAVTVIFNVDKDVMSSLSQDYNAYRNSLKALLDQLARRCGPSRTVWSEPQFCLAGSEGQP
jgi:hypothetical protein